MHIFDIFYQRYSTVLTISLSDIYTFDVPKKKEKETSLSSSSYMNVIERKKADQR